MALVKYLPIFTMARHYEHRPIFNIGHIGENESWTVSVLTIEHYTSINTTDVINVSCKI